jgi:hypothetical protein
MKKKALSTLAVDAAAPANIAYLRNQTSLNVRMMMAVSATTVTPSMIFTNRLSDLRCMKKRSTSAALPVAMRRLMTTLKRVKWTLATAMVNPRSKMSAAQTMTSPAGRPTRDPFKRLVVESMASS